MLYFQYKRAGLLPETVTSEQFNIMTSFMHREPERAESIAVMHGIHHKFAIPILNGHPPEAIVA
jgi:hypothetical protein